MKPLLLSLLLIIALSAHAADIDALLTKGDAERQQKRLRPAIEFYQQAEKAAPDNLTVLLRLSQTYSDLVDQSEKKEDGEKALAYAQRALAKDAKSAKAHLLVAIGYGKLTDYVGNRQKLEYGKIVKLETEKSLALDATDDYAWYMLGRWHYGVANINFMLKAMAQMIFGDMPPATNEEAIRCLRKAVHLAPEVLLYHSNLAKAYASAGKKAAARAEWAIVITLQPKDEEGQEDMKEARKELGK